MKKPYLKLFADVWLSDLPLRSVSLAARGLWIDLLATMQMLERPGYLQLAGKALTQAQIAQLCGATPAEVVPLLKELERAGVFHRTDSGVIYSRQLVRAAHNKDRAAERKRRQRGSVSP